MGSIALKAVSKKGKDALADARPLLEIPLTSLKGEAIDNFGVMMNGKRFGIVVNVAQN